MVKIYLLKFTEEKRWDCQFLINLREFTVVLPKIFLIFILKFSIKL